MHCILVHIRRPCQGAIVGCGMTGGSGFASTTGYAPLPVPGRKPQHYLREDVGNDKVGNLSYREWIFFASHIGGDPYQFFHSYQKVDARNYEEDSEDFNCNGVSLWIKCAHSSAPQPTSPDR